MARSPIQIMETINAAQPIIERLHDRIAASRSFHDLGDISVIQTTIRRIEECLGAAAELEDALRRQVARTSARIATSSPSSPDGCSREGLPNAGSQL